jgi:hypothetical protein
MRNLVLGLLIGVLLGLVLAGSVVTAQPSQRLFGTTTAGAAVPLKADQTGKLIVICQ